MFDKFDIWQYKANHNCWDYVREYLVEKLGIPSEDVPKYGIAPSNKQEMTKAAKDVGRSFMPCEPMEGAVACHYLGRAIQHVGIIHGGVVRHTSREWGTIKESVKDFERRCQKTLYFIHKSLCRH